MLHFVPTVSGYCLSPYYRLFNLHPAISIQDFSWSWGRAGVVSLDYWRKVPNFSKKPTQEMGFTQTAMGCNLSRPQADTLYTKPFDINGRLCYGIAGNKKGRTEGGGGKGVDGVELCSKCRVGALWTTLVVTVFVHLYIASLT